MKFVKKALRNVGHRAAWVLSYGLDLPVVAYAIRFWKMMYWYSLERRFRSTGQGCFIEYPAIVHGAQYISLGDNFQSFARLRLEAFDHHQSYAYRPEITIGDNVSLNYDCHIGCVNRITIGDNVLMGSRVFITDHFHGEINGDVLATPPSLRRVTSRGPVIIEDNVWLGEGVAIMPNVRIGRDSIVGANAVVTKDVPARCVVGGVPAKVIKLLSEE